MTQLKFEEAITNLGDTHPETKPPKLKEPAENFTDLISSLNGQIVNSLHNGNWIFLNKNVPSSCSARNNNSDNNSLTNYITMQKAYLSDIQRTVSEKRW